MCVGVCGWVEGVCVCVCGWVGVGGADRHNVNFERETYALYT